LRVARPTDRLEQISRMYSEGLGLQVLAKFEDHDGYDGVILGQPGMEYHLEFTRHGGHAAEGTASPEHLLAIYLPQASDWDATALSMMEAGFKPVTSVNPFWEACGRTFEDVDGYRVVLVRDSWPAASGSEE